MVNFWSHGLNPILSIICNALIFILDYILHRAYNHFITATLCEQLTSANSSLKAQTHYFISKAIKYGMTDISLPWIFSISSYLDDVHAHICTVELRKHFPCSEFHNA